jgi:hypothetical protein
MAITAAAVTQWCSLRYVQQMIIMVNRTEMECTAYYIPLQ